MGGSSGSSSQPVQTVAQSDPWSGAQPFLNQLYNSANTLATTGTGFQPYTGQMQAAIHPWQNQGLGNMYQIASNQGAGLQGMGAITAAQNLGANVIGNEGLTQDLRNTASKFGDIYSEASGQQNPYLQAILDTNNRRIGDRVNAAMSGAGRYGSGAHTDIMTRALAESADPILAQDYQNRQQLRQQAAGSLADLYGTGLQTAGKFAQIAPTVMEASYLPAQHMADLGQFYTQYAQQALNDQIKQYNALQAYPWEQLQRYAGILSGAGSLGGTTVTTSPGPQNPSTLQRVLGGSLAGASLGSAIPGIGTGIGALGGGLLGLF